MIKNRSIALFTSVLVIVSIITGLIYGLNNNISLEEFISSINGNNKIIIYHLVIILVFFILTLSYIGIVIEPIYISLESISIGYVISEFILNYKIGGLFYSLIYILINKLLFFIILLYLLYVTLNYFKRTIKNIFGNTRDFFIVLIKPLLKKYIIILIITIIYDVILYFFSFDLLNYFKFML